MILTWERDKGILRAGPWFMMCTCIVRNELNGRRSPAERPVKTENKDGSPGVPYFPRPFPLGEWTVLAAIPKDDPYLAPFFLSTDAHQLVEEWTAEGTHYGTKTNRIVEDWGYGLHCSTSISTLGCGRITMRKDLLDLVEAFNTAEKGGERMTLSVI